MVCKHILLITFLNKYMLICLFNGFKYYHVSKVKLVTVVEGDQKALFNSYYAEV